MSISNVIRDEQDVRLPQFEAKLQARLAWAMALLS